MGLSLRASVWQGMPGGAGSVLRLGREAATLQHPRGQLQHEPLDPEHHSVSCENPFILPPPPPRTCPPISGCDSPAESPHPLGPPAFPTLAFCDWTPTSDVCLQVRNVTQDGGFGPWSLWQPCEHLDGDNSGSCLCRARACDTPQPRCGGRDCLGPAIHIANCSRYVWIQGLHGYCLNLEWGIPSQMFSLKGGNHIRALQATGQVAKV